MGLIWLLKGYVEIYVTGTAIERFLNICKSNEIYFQNISNEENTYFMRIDIKSFYKLRTIAHKTHTKVAVVKRHGLPFFMHKFMKHKAFIFCFVLLILSWSYLSGLIWHINISGNQYITTNTVNELLEKNQIYVGRKRDDIDVLELQKLIRDSFPEVIWVSVELDGNSMNIELRENLTEMNQENNIQVMEGKDIISDYDGKILAIIVRKGIPMVKTGDSVNQNQILVKGEIPIYADDGTITSYQYTEADADILIEHSVMKSFLLPETYIQKQYTGRASNTFFILINHKVFKIPFKHGQNDFTKNVVKRINKLDIRYPGFPFRIEIYEENKLEYMNIEKKYSRDEAEEILYDKLSYFLESLREKGVQIIEKDVKIEGDEKCWLLECEMLLMERLITPGNETD